MKFNHQGNKRHGLFMMLLCIIPIVAVAYLVRMGLQIGQLGRFSPYAVLLICPLLHFGMMFFMMKGDCHSKKNTQVEE